MQDQHTVVSIMTTDRTMFVSFYSRVCRKFSWWGFHLVAYGGHLYLVCAVCDVLFMFPNKRFGEVC